MTAAGSEPDWTLIEHFQPSEFDGPDHLDEILLYMLDRTRLLAGRPIYITSDYRPQDDGAHGAGLAADISDNLRGEDLSSRWRFHVLRAAFEVGFLRIGIYDRHLHLDISESRDQEVCWTGESQ